MRDDGVSPNRRAAANERPRLLGQCACALDNLSLQTGGRKFACPPDWRRDETRGRLTSGASAKRAPVWRGGQPDGRSSLMDLSRLRHLEPAGVAGRRRKKRRERRERGQEQEGDGEAGELTSSDSARDFNQRAGPSAQPARAPGAFGALINMLRNTLAGRPAAQTSFWRQNMSGR